MPTMDDYEFDPQQPVNTAVADSRRFNSRDQVERAVLLDKGRLVGLEGTWQTCKDGQGRDKLDEEGKLNYTWGREIWVSRWSLRMMMQCSDRIAKIIATLFPNDLSFLFTVDTSQLATAAAKINEIIFYRVASEVFDICCITCGVMTDEERALFERKITPRDLLEIFTTIIEHEINNDNMQAITKKVRRLLGEKFSLENVFPNLSELTEELLTQFSTGTPPINLTSSPNTPQSQIDEMS